MTALRRWLLVALGLVVLVALPVLIGRIPASGNQDSAADLLTRVQSSGDVAYSGYAESVGGLGLPVTDQFTDLVNLFGERTQLRVWWRGVQSWRADTVSVTGETDIIQDADGFWQWDYESATALRTVDPDVRLPRGADLVPAALGRRLLSEATPAEVSTIGSARVAGVTAAGLRMIPADDRSTVGRVDVWVDPGTGLPLRVEVYGDDTAVPPITTSFLDVDITDPGASTVEFTPPPGVEASTEDAIDIAAAANRFAEANPPFQLAGLDLRFDGHIPGAVGLYGTGVTSFVAVPLWDRVAEPLRAQLDGTPGATIDDTGTAVQVGPLSLLLTAHVRTGQTWLLAGTVTPATLTQAAGDLPDVIGIR